jgi:hypothetical protein
MADLSRSPNRGSLRSRTHVGIAAAMALQWMPVVLVLEYCRTSSTYHSHPLKRTRMSSKNIHSNTRAGRQKTPTLTRAGCETPRRSRPGCTG